MDELKAAGVDTQESPRSEGPGGYIGPYKILQQLGEGGFGAVFEAEQTHPVKRRVALKIIKLGMDTREVINRFEAERQALALMDHPHIARVLDGGATASGRPYFVMELVPGEPLSSYCDRHSLTIVERLHLFEQVCAAVQHAHTKGVIHRDLKPSNVLVSTQEDLPFAKVIDFGIAKVTNSRLTDKTLFTAQNQMIGTPLYMSPEQAEGSADIDTRTDIYALGVMLYELLTGTTPFESKVLKSTPFIEVQRIIREVDPPRPSARLAEAGATLPGVAGARRSDSHRLTRVVRGELDWIVMKAIEKERARRYETANALAIDVRRYLAGLPIVAAPPSASYRLRKFVRRHKGPVAAGLLVAALLIVGIVGFAWQAAIAEQRAADLEQVSKFQAEMLGQVNPAQAGHLLSKNVKAKFEQALDKAAMGAAERAREIQAFDRLWERVNATDAARELIDLSILQPAVAAIEKQFNDQPVVDATLSQVLADRYAQMGLLDAALPVQQRALAIRRQALGGMHSDTLTSISSLGALLFAQGRRDEAELYYREALEKRRSVLGDMHEDTLTSINNMGHLLQAQGKLSEAETYFREALEKCRRVLGEEHEHTLILISNMGTLLRAQGKLAEAEPYWREALEKKRRVLGEDNPSTLLSISNMGVLLRGQGKLTDAEPYYREALEKYRRLLGDAHPDTLRAISNMGVLLLQQGKLGDAEPHYREALDTHHRVLGAHHPSTLQALNNMATLRVAQAQYAEAIALLVPAEAATRYAFSGAESYHVSKFLMNLGKARSGLGDFALAETHLLEAHAICVRFPGPLPKNLQDCTQALVDFYSAWHRAHPREGHEAKAAEWRRKLEESDVPIAVPAAA